MSSRLVKLSAAILFLFVSGGCMAAYRGNRFAKRLEWDSAVEQYRLAVEQKPANEVYEERLSQCVGEAAEVHRRRAEGALKAPKSEDDFNRGIAEIERAAEYAEDRHAPATTRASTKKLKSWLVQAKHDRLVFLSRQAEQKAERLLQEAKLLSARKKLLEALGHWDGNEDARHRLEEVERDIARASDSLQTGKNLMQQKEWEQAKTRLGAALEVNAELSEIPALIDRCSKETAVDGLVEEAKQSNQRRDFLRSIAVLEKAVGILQEREDAQRMLVAAKHSHARVLLGRARQRFTAKEWADAVRICEEAKRFWPRWQDVETLEAQAKTSWATECYGEGGRFEKRLLWASALAQYLKARSLVPGFRDTSRRIDACEASLRRELAFSVEVAEFRNLTRDPAAAVRLQRGAIAESLKQVASIPGLKSVSAVPLTSTQTIGSAAAQQGSVVTVKGEFMGLSVSDDEETQETSQRYRSGYRTCPSCRGRRAVTCPKCGGDGKYSRDYSSQLGGYTGAGSVVHFECDACLGWGAKPTGRVLCKTCDGEGKLPIYRDWQYTIHYITRRAEIEMTYSIAVTGRKAPLVWGEVVKTADTRGQYREPENPRIGIHRQGLAERPNSRDEVRDRAFQKGVTALVEAILAGARKYGLKYYDVAKHAEDAGRHEDAFENYARFLLTVTAAGDAEKARRARNYVESKAGIAFPTTLSQPVHE